MLRVAQVLVGTVFVLSAVMMGAKFYIDRNVQREDVRRPAPLWRAVALTCLRRMLWC